jgi:dihydroorotate dehydrogenase
MALYPLLRPLVFSLDAERAHRLTIAALKALPAASRRPSIRCCDPRRRARLPLPVGLAAGFDKDAEVFDADARLGFGFVEVGTLTPLPQAGNPKPRCSGWSRTGGDQPARLQQWRAGGGAGAAARRARAAGLVGVNIGANKDSADRIADYAEGVRAMAPVADYLTVNISSPNTPGLRALQDKARSTSCWRRCGRARRGGAAGLPQGRARPGARATRTTSSGGARPRHRRADRRQHHRQPARRCARATAGEAAACRARR